MPATDNYGVHECLHMASFLAQAVDCQLCEHDAVKANGEWFDLAEKAQKALYDLYQSIAREHLKD